MTTRLVNIKKESCDIYIGRGKKGVRWGNPYSTLESNDREEAIERYRLMIMEKIKNKELSRQDFEELKGKRLGCFCVPYNRCHGEVLIEIVENLDTYFPFMNHNHAEMMIITLGVMKSYQFLPLVLDNFFSDPFMLSALSVVNGDDVKEDLELLCEQKFLSFFTYFSLEDFLSNSKSRNMLFIAWDGNNEEDLKNILGKTASSQISTYVFDIKNFCYISV